MAEQKPEEACEKVSVASTLPPVTEAERDLAQQATDEFEGGNYDAAANLLKKLANTRAADPRLVHNQAVVEFYQSGCTKTEEFRKTIKETQVDVNNVSCLDDVDQFALFYNHAVILYHLRQYKAALAIMDKLFSFIEPMEEGLSRKVMFLLIELYICTQQPEKALGMISMAEKHLYGNGKTQHVTPEKEGSKEKELTAKDKDKDKDTKESSPDSTADAWKGKISLLKARCYMMLKSIKPCKREVKTLMNTLGLGAPTVYMKANFEYVRGNYRKAIKVLNTTPVGQKTAAEHGEHLTVMYYNNMAAIHCCMKKHNLGAFYLRKALQENTRICAEYNKVSPSKWMSGRPVQTLGLSRHYELMYNLGVQLLHCGKPKAAFECLIESVGVFQVNPRLWLRLAECCVMAHRTSNDVDRQLNEKSKVIVGTLGSGIHRKLLLGDGGSKPKPRADSAATPAISLDFAMMCVRNALTLLPEDPLDVPPTRPDEQSENRPSDIGLVLAPPGNPMKSNEVANLRCSVLALGAYVALSLNDYVVALHHAEKLLRQPRLSGAHRYVGHMYMGEALTSLDRIADAVSHLNPDAITDVSTVPPEHRPDSDKSEKNGEKDSQETNEAKGSLYPWLPKDVTRARAIMQYNLATAHAIRGEYEKAIAYLRKSSENIGSPMPAHMYYLRIYVELMENGRRKLTQGFIKDNFGYLPQNHV